MDLDLSSLDDPQDGAPSGAPLQIPLDRVSEDPNQPRTEFDPETMDEMTASVAQRGIKSPVSVRPDPDTAGAWILNHGARRLRAAIAAGLDSIPAFVDEQYTEYDQVIENLQRDALKPMELALFIDRQMKAGVKKGEIAKRLSVAGPVITQHLTLIDAPAFIDALYSTGRCTSPTTLYNLRRLHDKYPDAVEAWCASDEGISRQGVAALSARLKDDDAAKEQGGGKSSQEEGERSKAGTDESDKTNADDKTASTGTSESSSHLPANDTAGVSGTPGSDNSGENPTDDEDSETEQHGKSQESDGDKKPTTLPPTGDLSSWETKKPSDDPTRLKKPLLIVSYNDRAAAVLLSRRPSTDGLLWIKYEDNGEEIEIDAGACAINLLTEG